jgi:LPPG:FO 2-phospho-L-lactate transferase
MSDQDVRTCFDTEAGWLAFQEYFVRERLRPALRGLRFDGLSEARPSPEVAEAIASAGLVIIGPSNPLISIAPILGVVGPLIEPRRTLAVTPLVGGRALKGPTAEMMRTLRGEATAVRVAEEYRRQARLFVLDRVDAATREAVAALGYRVLVTDTVMEGREGERRLAAAVLEFAGQALQEE